MAAPPLFFRSYNASPVAVTGSTEIVVATVSTVTMRYPGQTVTLFGWCLDTTGSTTTAVILQWRRASLTGTQVGDHTGQTIAAAAGSTELFTRIAQDTPAEIDNSTYVLTLTHTGGGTGGTTVVSYGEACVD